MCDKRNVVVRTNNVLVVAHSKKKLTVTEMPSRMCYRTRSEASKNAPTRPDPTRGFFVRQKGAL